MSESRTIEATPHRLARVRARFGRPSSGELTAASAFVVAAIALPGLAAGGVTAFGSLWQAVTGAARSSQPRAVVSSGGLANTAAAPLAELVALSIGMLVALAVTAGAATALQRGAFIRVAGAGGAGLETRIPSENFAARISRSVLSLAKWLVFVAVVFAPWADAIRGMLGAWQRRPDELLPIAGSLILAVLSRAAIALVVLGVIDFAVQQVAFRRRLRMSRQELREEQKATEADPHATAERKRRGRELQARVALAELDEVVLVVCDFEGRAFGVREKGVDVMVWIRGDGELGVKIRTEAEARGIPLRVDRELATALVRAEIGEPLPETIAARLRRARGA